jgi:hypothetical protein
MITFKQFLTEAETKDLVQYLRKNCLSAVRDIIKAKKFLWRGMNPKLGYEKFKAHDQEIEVAFGQPRDDRRPTDTPAWAHAIIDKYFEEKFSQALRSTSTFVFNNKAPAQTYGVPHIIIPIGKYSLYWSKSVGDLTTDLFPDFGDRKDTGLAGGEHYWVETKNIELDKVTREMEKEYILDQLQKFHYQRGPNDEAIEAGHGELMLVCARYLAVRPISTVPAGHKFFGADELLACVYEAALE